MESSDNDRVNEESANSSVDMKEYLMGTVKWANIIAIAGYIMIDLLVISGLCVGAIFSEIKPTLMHGSFFHWIPLVFIGTAIICFFPIYYLQLFVQQTKPALKANSDLQLIGGARYLKLHFKYIGIFIFTVLTLILLLIIRLLLVEMSS